MCKMLNINQFDQQTIFAYRLDKLLSYKHPSSSAIPESRGLESASTIEEALSLSITGGIEKAIYVLGADCGTGKSTSIIEALREWKADRFNGDGAIIFVSTLAEIDHFVISAGLESPDYAAQTGNKDYTHYGSGRHLANEVPVLFATHSKARRALREAGSFEAASCFHYRGKARSLRVWDEALSPAQCSSFRLDDLSALPSAFKGLPKVQRNILFDL